MDPRSLVAADSPDVWVLVLPWTSPPLSLNDRYKHWSTKSQKNRMVRDAVHVLAYRAGIPPLGRCSVELVYQPPDRRDRDEDNLVATLKPACDGLVLAGVVEDDTPAYMTKPMPRIGEVRRPGRVLLIVRRLEVES